MYGLQEGFPRGPSNQPCAFRHRPSTATETPIVPLLPPKHQSSQYCHRNCSQHQSSHPPRNCKQSAERGQSRFTSSLHWSPAYTITSTTSGELTPCTRPGNVPHVMEALLFTGGSRFTLLRPAGRRRVGRRRAQRFTDSCIDEEEGGGGGGGQIWVWLSHGLGWNFPWV